MLQKIIDFSLQIHIFSGFIAVVCFWVIISIQKGNKLHKMIGRTYFMSMIGLVVSSIINCMYYVHQEITTGHANKGGRFSYTMLFIASLIAITPAFTALYAQQTKLVNKAHRSYLILINFFVLVCCLILSVLHIFSFPSIAVLGAIIVPIVLIPTLIYLKKFDFEQLLGWHIKWMIQSGIALHVGFLGGGLSYRYFNNNNIHITVPLYSIIFIVVMSQFQKYFFKKYISSKE